MIRNLYSFKSLFWIGLLLLVLVACRDGESTPTGGIDNPTPQATHEIKPTKTHTPTIPTPTPEPLAVRVNGEGITLAEYRAELDRYRDAVGRELTDEDEQWVLNDLIYQLLLAQGAEENGYSVSDELLQERFDRLVEDAGSRSALDDWLSENHYDEDSFLVALRRNIAGSWMRDQVAVSLPEAVEQVHAQQILFLDAQEAEELHRRLQGGADFTELAAEYNPVTRGDLGWFPRGYLPHPAIEEAAFGLGVGQFSGVIETDIGYHIIFVIEREPERPLEPDARLVLNARALQAWLDDRYNQADIEVY